MRIRQTTMIALLNIAVSAWSAPTSLLAAPASVQPTAAQCAAARSLIAIQRPKNGSADTLGTAAPERISTFYGAQQLNSGWGSQSPDSSLVRELLSAPSTSVFACSGMDRAAGESGLKVLPGGGARMPGDGSYNLVGLPVVSRDGLHALAYVVTKSSQGLGGSDRVIFLRRDRATWTLAGVKPLSMS